MSSCLSASYPLCTVLYEPREGHLSVFLLSTCCLSSWSSLKPLAPIEGLSHRAVFVNVLTRTLQDSLCSVYDRADSYSHSVYSLSCCQLRFFVGLFRFIFADLKKVSSSNAAKSSLPKSGLRPPGYARLPAAKLAAFGFVRSSSVSSSVSSTQAVDSTPPESSRLAPRKWAFSCGQAPLRTWRAWGGQASFSLCGKLTIWVTTCSCHYWGFKDNLRKKSSPFGTSIFSVMGN